MQMNSFSRRTIISCLVILLVICLCLSFASILGAGIIFSVQSNSNQVDFFSQPNNQTENFTNINQQLKQIESQITELRGWEPKSEVVENFLTPSELRQHVLDDFLNEYSLQDAKNDALVLWAFGLLDRNFDIYNLYVDLYTEQIAGFYDQKLKEMFVVQEDVFAGPERITYAHEFVHALQDQYYDIENGLLFNDQACENDTERCAAISALLEGDASLTEAFWFSSHATLEDQQQISEFYSDFVSPVYDSAPAFMKEDFIFPYQSGQKFVETLYNQGGWDLVNQAYENPPISTEQILHPEKYPTDIPKELKLPDFSELLDEGWNEIDRGVMGEWYTYLILSMGYEANGRISTAKASQAAQGWEGDSYVVLYNESRDEIIMVLLTQWEKNIETKEFVSSLEEFNTNRFGQTYLTKENTSYWESPLGIQAAWSNGFYSAWIIAPDQTSVDAIWSKFELP